VDFKAKTATVTMEPGRELTREASEAALEGTRYELRGFRERAAADADSGG